MTDPKLVTLPDLYYAQVLVRNMEAAKTQLEKHLSPALQDYLDFLPERGSARYPHHKRAAEYTFEEVETTTTGDLFSFRSPEYYEYGSYERDVVELPFAFVDDPEAYKAEVRRKNAEVAALLSEAQREKAKKDVLYHEAKLAEAKLKAGLTTEA